MKKIKVIITMAIAMFGFTALNAQSTKIMTDKVVADTVYYCPMKCEGDKTYDKVGKCPICNMKLKPTPKPAAVIFQCPMKCEGDKTYNNAGKCPVCNMALKKRN